MSSTLNLHIGLATGSTHNLATLCRDNFRESFPEIGCVLVYYDDGRPVTEPLEYRAVAKLLLSDRDHDLLSILFYEHCTMAFSHGSSDCYEVSYGDPKFIDILLSALMNVLREHK